MKELAASKKIFIENKIFYIRHNSTSFKLRKPMFLNIEIMSESIVDEKVLDAILKCVIDFNGSASKIVKSNFDIREHNDHYMYLKLSYEYKDEFMSWFNSNEEVITYGYREITDDDKRYFCNFIVDSVDDAEVVHSMWRISDFVKGLFINNEMIDPSDVGRIDRVKIKARISIFFD